MDWHSGVYKMNNEEPIPNWHEVRSRILKRDNYTCFRCEATNKKNLTVHHLIPRNEGGQENEENLITLCSSCHDFVEIEGLRTLIEIEASYQDLLIIENKSKPDYKRVESFTRPDWHQYVYGGKRRSDH